MKQLRCLCWLPVLIMLSVPLTSYAKTYKQCFRQASKTYSIPYGTLLAVAFTESSFRPHAFNKNRNGSVDVGFMQINSVWKKAVARRGFSWQQVRNDPCVNVRFGAQILRNNYKRLKNWPHAVGAYNVGFAVTPKARKKRLAYYAKVMRNKPTAIKYAYRLNKTAAGVGVLTNKKQSSHVYAGNNLLTSEDGTILINSLEVIEPVMLEEGEEPPSYMIY